MDKAAGDAVIRALLTQINRQLSHAAGIADAAQIFAENGQLKAAVNLVMDVEDPAYMADRMLKAILLIRSELQGEILD